MLHFCHTNAGTERKQYLAFIAIRILYYTQTHIESNTLNRFYHRQSALVQSAALQCAHDIINITIMHTMICSGYEALFLLFSLLPSKWICFRITVFCNHNFVRIQTKHAAAAAAIIWVAIFQRVHMRIWLWF